MNSIDIFVQNYFSLVHTLVLTKFMLIMTNLFEVVPLVLITFFIAILIYYKKGLRDDLLFIISLGIGEVFVFVLKNFFDISRPLNGLVVETSKSFPSGHATAVTIFFVMLMYLFAKDMNKVWRTVFVVFCVLMITLVSVSRLYLGVHWLSDVLGGVALGLFVSYISVAIFNKLYKKI